MSSIYLPSTVKVVLGTLLERPRSDNSKEVRVLLLAKSCKII